MPELPEVETICRYLNTVLPGKTIQKTVLLLPRQLRHPDPASFTALTEGKTIDGCSRRGKYIRLGLSDGTELILHLRMTGSLYYTPEPQDDRYARLYFELDDGGRLMFSDLRTFGTIAAIVPGETYSVSGMETLGPEPLENDFTSAYLFGKLKRSKAPVKSFLLNQQNVAGLGNIYVDEALFLAGIHPLRHGADLTKLDAEHLVGAIRQVLEAGIRDGGTTFRNYRNGEGGFGEHQEHLAVYHRNGEPCRRCGTVIEKIKVGGRGTHFCPHCQPLPEHDPATDDMTDHNN